MTTRRELESFSQSNLLKVLLEIFLLNLLIKLLLKAYDILDSFNFMSSLVSDIYDPIINYNILIKFLRL